MCEGQAKSAGKEIQSRAKDGGSMSSYRNLSTSPARQRPLAGLYRGVGITFLVLFGSLSLLSSVALASKEGQPFGITSFTMQTTHTVEKVEDGARIFENVPYAFTQAGGHPEALTTTLKFATEVVESPSGKGKEPNVVPTRDPKDVAVGLPAGLLGDPMAVPRCSLTQLLGKREACPADTQVGVARLRWFGLNGTLGPIVNVTPEAGQSAEFALENKDNIPFLETARLVRTAQGSAGCTTAGGCYGFTIVSHNIPTVELSEVEETFWGVPADASHDPMRGLFCQLVCSASEPQDGGEGGGARAGVTAVPFLTWPTDCSAGPEVATARGDSWEMPGRVEPNGQYVGYAEATPVALPGSSGCGLLSFAPSLEVQPDTLLADEPAGLDVSLKVPLNESPETSATPQLRDSAVTLPEGMSVSPGVVDGIQACEASGPNGIDITGPESEEVGLNGELQLAAGHCPDASTVGTAEAITPFLPVPVKGHIYLAKPGCGGVEQAPCTDEDALDGNLYKLYLELGGAGELAGTGIEFKVPGFVEVDPATGQLTTKFLDTVQAPFSELKIDLNGGPRASLANPAVCGPAYTSADFTPWSAPGTTPEGLLTAGTPDATPSSFYVVDGCAGRPGLDPGFSAGTVTPQAGQFSAFTLNFSRQDREQFVKGIQVHTPPGLLGVLSSVPLCGEAQANAGTCPEASKIGSTRVASGAGSHPFEIEGTVYLTGPHDGAPFGLSIVTQAVAGPFNLGLVIVRARIDVNPEDSTLTVTTDETGPYALPQILFGVPLRLQRITVDIDRPGFMFNPTNCGAPGSPGSQQVTAVLSGSENAKTTVQSQFAVGGCKSLEFKPKFTVSTSSHTSRAGGASLDAKLSYPPGSLGNDANIARVKVDLPKQLPSRLTTLQKACTAQVFASDPANCPAASVVGIAKATTPLLPVKLEGPLYFVSHGGEAFPSLIVVLQGDGVRVDLTGATFISRTGITSSTFKTVPDVPVNTFELFLPEGKYSALAANGNLCTAKLTMPTEFAAQNGAVIHQTTKITTTGCTKTNKTKPKKKKKTKPKQASKNRRANS
jgi:hypothetical protein